MDLPLKDMTWKPLTDDRWEDLAALFTERGVQNGCWCMYWRVARRECQQNYGEGNRQALRRIVRSGGVPGLLAYHLQKPVGWVSVAPRQDFAVLGRSPTLKPVDDQPVWSIVCFFVSRPYRRSGMTGYLIGAALCYARENGARIVEAYPIDIHARYLEIERYSGLTTTFEKAGFKLALQRSKRRPILRYDLREDGH